MRYRKRAEQWIVITICLLGGIPTSFAEGTADADQLPDLEMLEYLGSWETEDGEWFDPLQLFELTENSVPTANDKRRADD